MGQSKGFGSNKFPKFVFEGNADLGFQALIKKAIQQFDFNALSSKMRSFLHDFKENGYEKVVCRLKKDLSDERNIDKKNRKKIFLQNVLFLQSHHIGEIVFDKIPKEQIQQYLPLNNVDFFFKKTEIIVQFRTLKKIKNSQGISYYSRLEPTVEVDGNRYKIAFTKHAIDRICERLSPKGLTYSSLGDIYAYLEACVYFETCKLRNGRLAITFWDWCGSNIFWNYQYVEKVLGKKNLIPTKGYPYFRLGYCPIVIEDGFLIAKTLLFPGYTQTPEYEYLLNSELSKTERTNLRHKATKQDAKSLSETGDFSCIKWFHINAIPQVVQMEEIVYAHHKTLPSNYHKNEYFLSGD